MPSGNSFFGFSFLTNVDTFASKVAAIQDKYADASVGNVTGSNAVNVFLGIGVAWTIGMLSFSPSNANLIHFIHETNVFTRSVNSMN